MIALVLRVRAQLQRAVDVRGVGRRVETVAGPTDHQTGHARARVALTTVRRLRHLRVLSRCPVAVARAIADVVVAVGSDTCTQGCPQRGGRGHVVAGREKRVVSRHALVVTVSLIHMRDRFVIESEARVIEVRLVIPGSRCRFGVGWVIRPGDVHFRHGPDAGLVDAMQRHLAAVTMLHDGAPESAVSDELFERAVRLVRELRHSQPVVDSAKAQDDVDDDEEGLTQEDEQLQTRPVRHSHVDDDDDAEVRRDDGAEQAITTQLPVSETGARDAHEDDLDETEGGREAGEDDAVEDPLKRHGNGASGLVRVEEKVEGARRAQHEQDGDQRDHVTLHAQTLPDVPRDEEHVDGEQEEEQREAVGVELPRPAPVSSGGRPVRARLWPRVG